MGEPMGMLNLRHRFNVCATAGASFAQPRAVWPGRWAKSPWRNPFAKSASTNQQRVNVSLSAATASPAAVAVALASSVAPAEAYEHVVVRKRSHRAVAGAPVHRARMRTPGLLGTLARPLLALIH